MCRAVNKDVSRFYASNSDFYSEIQELTQILLRISEEKIGGWGLWCMALTKCSRKSLPKLGSETRGS